MKNEALHIITKVVGITFNALWLISAMVGTIYSPIGYLMIALVFATPILSAMHLVKIPTHKAFPLLMLFLSGTFIGGMIF